MEKQTIYRSIATLHAEKIDGGFLPQLGHRMLSLLYQAIDESSDGLLFFELEDDAVIGFVAGTFKLRSIYLQIFKHPLSLFLATLNVLVSIRKIRRVFEVLHHTGSDDRSKYPKAELLSIAVSTDHQGKGVSKQLYTKLLKAFRDREERSFCIVVGEQLARAHAFYVKMGAKPVAEISVHEDSTSIVYVHDLSIS